MDKIFEWQDFKEPPTNAVWDIKFLHDNQEKIINKVYFKDGKIFSWYNRWVDFDKKYPNNKILQIKLSKG